MAVVGPDGPYLAFVPRSERAPGQFRRIQNHIGWPDDRVARELAITNQGAEYLLGQLEVAGIIRPVDKPGGRAKRWVAQHVCEAVGRCNPEDGLPERDTPPVSGP